jgi:DNA-3-methyladenine glycosylase II
MQFQSKLRSGQYHLAKNDPALAVLIMKYGDASIKPHRDYYSELVTSIVGQQLSIHAAAAIWQRLLVIAGGKPPTPQQLLEIDETTLRQVGLSRPKIGYVKDLAEHILDGRLDMEHISSLPNDQIIEQLTAVKGIGEWSAHMFMLFGLGRLDILPWGDLGIKKAAQQIYKLKELPDKAKLESIAKKHKWAPYQSIASWYLWKSLENEGIRIKKGKN